VYEHDANADKLIFVTLACTVLVVRCQAVSNCLCCFEASKTDVNVQLKKKKRKEKLIVACDGHWHGVTPV